MTDQQQPRPPLWRVLADSYDDAFIEGIRDAGAVQIRALAVYLIDHGLVNTAGCAIPRSGPHLLEVLEQEAKRAEAGE